MTFSNIFLLADLAKKVNDFIRDSYICTPYTIGLDRNGSSTLTEMANLINEYEETYNGDIEELRQIFIEQTKHLEPSKIYSMFYGFQYGRCKLLKELCEEDYQTIINFHKYFHQRFQKLCMFFMFEEINGYAKLNDYYKEEDNQYSLYAQRFYQDILNTENIDLYSRDFLKEVYDIFTNYRFREMNKDFLDSNPKQQSWCLKPLNERPQNDTQDYIDGIYEAQFDLDSKFYLSEEQKREITREFMKRFYEKDFPIFDQYFEQEYSEEKIIQIYKGLQKRIFGQNFEEYYQKIQLNYG